MLPDPETNEHITADRMGTVVGLYRIRHRISCEISTDSSFYMTEEVEVTGVTDSVSTDSEGTSKEDVEMLLQVWLIAEQLILVHQFKPASDEVPTADRHDRLCQVGIQVAECGRTVRAA